MAPKVNDLYTRKSTHIVDRIQRMQKINEIAIVIGAPLMWAFLSAVGIPYTGAIMCTAWVGLVVIRRLYVTKFDAPDSSLDSYQYLKAFQRWLKDRLAWGRRVQRHLYAVTFLALAIGGVASAGGQLVIRSIVESNPDLRLVNGVPLILIAGVVATAIVVDLLGGGSSCSSPYFVVQSSSEIASLTRSENMRDRRCGSLPPGLAVRRVRRRTTGRLQSSPGTSAKPARPTRRWLA